MAASLERLFDRYRRRGDRRALGRIFDRTAPELLRVATHVTRDPVAAEDLVQATFLAAIETAPSFDGSRRLVPWLAGILTNLARRKARREARRPDPDRLGTRTENDPRRGAQDRETSHAVREAIDGLEEPYREVLVLRLLHDLEPAEIAYALGRAPGTVRSQIHRGKELLKRALPKGMTAAALVGLFPTRGLAAVRATVLAHAGLGKAAATAVAVGGITMSKVGWTAAAVVVGIAAWVATRPARDQDVARTPVAQAPKTGASEPAPPTIETVSAPAATENRKPVREPAPDGLGSVLVRATWADGTPAANVGVRVAHLSAPDSPSYVERGITGPDGTFRVQVDPGAVEVRAVRGGKVRTQVVADSEIEAVLNLAAGTRVTGVVVDPGGGRVEGASIWLTAPDSSHDGFVAARTNERGEFTLRGIRQRHTIFALSDRLGPSKPQVIKKAGPELRIRLVLVEFAGSIAGRVFDPEGEAVAGATVWVSVGRGRSLWRVVRSSANGRFHFKGVATGIAQVLIGARGFGPVSTSVIVPAGGIARLNRRLGPAATVFGTVRDAGGAIARGARVRTKAGYEVFRGRTTTNGNGEFQLLDLPAGELTLVAGGGKEGEAEAVLKLSSGEQTRWDPVLKPPGTLTGLVSRETGAPLGGWWVLVYSQSTRRWAKAARTDAEGRFSISDAPRGPYNVFVKKSKSAGIPSLSRRRLPKIDGLRLVVEENAMPSARMIADAPGGAGPHLKGAWVLVLKENRSGRLGGFPVDPKSRRLSAGPLPPGRYFLRLQIPRQLPIEIGVVTLAKDQILDLGQLPTGRLTVFASAVDGVDLSGLRCRVQREGESLRQFFPVTDRRMRVEHLSPGRYRVRLVGKRIAAVDRLVVVRADGDERIRLVARPGWKLPVKLDLVSSAQATAVTFVVRDARGEEVVREQLHRRVSSPYTTLGWTFTLAAGRYRIEARTDKGTTVEAEAEITEDASWPVELRPK